MSANNRLGVDTPPRGVVGRVRSLLPGRIVPIRTDAPPFEVDATVAGTEPGEGPIAGERYVQLEPLLRQPWRGDGWGASHRWLYLSNAFIALLFAVSAPVAILLGIGMAGGLSQSSSAG